MIGLIDTNILLDVLQKRDPYIVDARRLWDLAERRVFDGFVSAISFNNIYYILRKNLADLLQCRAYNWRGKSFELFPSMKVSSITQSYPLTMISKTQFKPLRRGKSTLTILFPATRKISHPPPCQQSAQWSFWQLFSGKFKARPALIFLLQPLL